MSTVKNLLQVCFDCSKVFVLERVMKIIIKNYSTFWLVLFLCNFPKYIDIVILRFCGILIDQSVKFVKAVTTVSLSSVIKKPKKIVTQKKLKQQ